MQVARCVLLISQCVEFPRMPLRFTIFIQTTDSYEMFKTVATVGPHYIEVLLYLENVSCSYGTTFLSCPSGYNTCS